MNFNVFIEVKPHKQKQLTLDQLISQDKQMAYNIHDIADNINEFTCTFDDLLVASEGCSIADTFGLCLK